MPWECEVAISFLDFFLKSKSYSNDYVLSSDFMKGKANLCSAMVVSKKQRRI